MNLVVKIFTLSMLSYSFSVLAYSEAEKKAFCKDYSRGYANSYETTKAYQYCYSNANVLIDRYESKKIEKVKQEEMRKKQLESNPFSILRGN
jgi:hypothetical protein